MKKLLLAGLMFATMSSAALAAEPLTNDRLDAVTAGVTITRLLVVNINGNLNSLNGLNANFTTQTVFVVTP